jgi:hypothetical protein
MPPKAAAPKIPTADQISALRRQKRLSSSLFVAIVNIPGKSYLISG